MVMDVDDGRLGCGGSMMVKRSIESVCYIRLLEMRMVVGRKRSSGFGRSAAFKKAAS